MFYAKSTRKKKALAWLPFLLITLTCCSQSEERKIEDTCNNYMKGRIALRSGDTLLLKSVTSDSLFKLLMLHHQYQEILNAPLIKADLYVQVKQVRIQDSCATCLMAASEFYQINVCKVGDEWKVRGENNEYPSAEKLNDAQKKLNEQRIYLKQKPSIDSVFRVIDQFFVATKKYFGGNEFVLPEKVCDEASIQFVKRLHEYSTKRTATDMILAELKIYSSSVGNVFFDSDKASFPFYDEEVTVNLRKTENGYLIIGFNGMESTSISDQTMQDQYLNFLRALKVVRSEKYRNKKIQ
ncbi:MAG: hypothetical protein ACKVOK_09395 [Flavobacteriales bacterium]